MNKQETALLKSLQLLMETNGLTGAVLVAVSPEGAGDALAVTFHVSDPLHPPSFAATEALALCIRGILHEADKKQAAVVEEGFIPKTPHRVQ